MSVGMKSSRFGSGIDRGAIRKDTGPTVGTPSLSADRDWVNESQKNRFAPRERRVSRLQYRLMRFFFSLLSLSSAAAAATQPDGIYTKHATQHIK